MKKLTVQYVSWACFIFLLVIIAAVYSLYGVNIVRWQNSPDFGWRAMYDSGPNVVAEVFESGKIAGLRAGDTIQAINGRSYNTFDELYFGNIRYEGTGSLNTYTVIRNKEPIEIKINTGRVGITTVLTRSGALLVIGLIYVMIGVLVFLMKPHVNESWVFFFMTTFIGMRVSFSAPSDLIHPLWFYDIRLLLDVFTPAPIVHLALIFPKRRSFLINRPRLLMMPYLLSFILLVLMKLTSTAYWNTPPGLDLSALVYLMSSILVFLILMIWNILKDTSVTIRLQSQVIFLGIILGLFIPATDLISRALWKISLFSKPSINFTIFLSLFPLSIGYTIVKHDLFAIDTIVRRTYGYILSTVSIVGAYVLIISAVNVTFRSAEISRSPLFSIGFALGVVFFFDPIHKRFRRVVDRVFYRHQYDYRKTIKDASEVMTSILDHDAILKRLIMTVVKEMYLENGILFIPDAAGNVYKVQVTEGINAMNIVLTEFYRDAPVLRALRKKNNTLLRSEIDLDPLFGKERETLQDTFQSLSSEVMIPMIYKEEIRGFISLGRKKSGKMFTQEDLDLLRTMTNQSIIALENAKLFKENIVKERMEEELKIAHDIQVGMLPDNAPEIKGFNIAARSIPAREVGGDFYDFIELGGNGHGYKLGFVIGDVSGKGVSAALMMAASRSTYRVLADYYLTVEEVMNKGNQRLNKDIKKGMFVALLYAVLDTEERTLTTSNAGQTQPIICRRGESEPFYIETDGDRFPLGIVTDCQYEESQTVLNEGDTVVFYTDGVVEAMNAKGELYGFDRFMTAINKLKGLDAGSLIEKLLNDILSFTGDVEQHDDLTIVVMKVE